MYYSESEARRLVILAGHLLVDKKLIARTWGNISARIGQGEFIITPSGKPYESLSESELVKVKISDLSYEGNLKPSSEKGVHAAAYSLRRDVNFVIHTHQTFATAISVEGQSFDFAPNASYALSGTEKLRNAVSEVVKNNPQSKAFLMQRHGALCLGESFEDAFAAAENLEMCSNAHFKAYAGRKSERARRRPYLDDYAQMAGFGSGFAKGEDPGAMELIKKKNALAADYVQKAKPLGFFDVILQHAVYKLKYSRLKEK